MSMRSTFSSKSDSSNRVVCMATSESCNRPAREGGHMELVHLILPRPRTPHSCCWCPSCSCLVVTSLQTILLALAFGHALKAASKWTWSTRHCGLVHENPNMQTVTGTGMSAMSSYLVLQPHRVRKLRLGMPAKLIAPSSHACDVGMFGLLI